MIALICWNTRRQSIPIDWVVLKRSYWPIRRIRLSVTPLGEDYAKKVDQFYFWLDDSRPQVTISPAKQSSCCYNSPPRVSLLHFWFWPPYLPSNICLQQAERQPNAGTGEKDSTHGIKGRGCFKSIDLTTIGSKIGYQSISNWWPIDSLIWIGSSTIRPTDEDDCNSWLIGIFFQMFLRHGFTLNEW